MTSQLIDVGANLTKPVFRRDFPAVLSRAADAGVSAIVVTGTTLPTSEEACGIARRETRRDELKLYATAGVHPHHATTLSPQALSELRSMLVRPEVVAVGECGLDYNRNYSPQDVQRRAFEAQLELAADVRKPLFLHDRDAGADFTEILSRWRSRIVGGVVHCFTGDRATIERYLALDMHIGITGWICDDRRGSHLRELVKIVPRGRLMVETDAPFLLPRDLPRGEGHPQYGDRPGFGRNEPALVAHVARAVARYRGETFEDLACHTTDAARALFALPDKEGRPS
jgi:TatD DNase family protein